MDTVWCSNRTNTQQNWFWNGYSRLTLRFWNGLPKVLTSTLLLTMLKSQIYADEPRSCQEQRPNTQPELCQNLLFEVPLANIHLTKY